MRTEIQQEYQLKPENLIIHLRDGKEDAREILIKTYWDFIMFSAAKLTGKKSDSTDEFSVALQAFNEAIDCFDASKNMSFLNFAGLVINRRLIGYFRKNQRYQAEHSFSSLEHDEDGEAVPLDISAPAIALSERYEIQEEISFFKESLMTFGITFDNLLNCAPKHSDTRALCAKIALKLHQDKELSGKLLEDKRLPIAQILTSFSLSRKTIEKNRKYIIALFLILNGDMDILKGYIASSIKEAEKR